MICFSKGFQLNFKINWDDFNWEKSYHPFSAYSQSKLANILFINKLAERLEGEN